MKQLKKLFITLTILTGIMVFCLPLWAAEAEEAPVNDLAALEEMLQQIEEKALDPVDKQQLIDGALKGMMEALKDPHSVYFNPEEREKFDTHINGAFGGIGVVMSQRPEGITVINIIAEQPAARTNMRQGDVICAVNGQDLADISLEEAGTLIRGEIGTTVVLTVRHTDGTMEDISIVREKVEINPVTTEMKKDNIGYIGISNFSANTKKNFNAALQELKEKGCEGLVLDLRDNPGGLMTAGLDVASVLTPQGKLLTVQGRDGKVINAYQSLVDPRIDVPLAVLINKNSASASEIVAGAIKDHGSGTLVGETSYGKATMQQAIPLSNGGEMKITFAHYLTPSGNLIEGKGIVPDVAVKDTRGETATPYQLPAALVYGSRGEAVKTLQQYLNHLQFNAGSVDGIFGPKTHAAVQAMQKAYKLPVTGKVDQAVMNALFKHLPQATPCDAQLEKALEIVSSLRRGLEVEG